MSGARDRGARAHRFGLAAEEGAARHLEADGMTILARRHRTPYGEIDLIARDGETLVFVEVKARSSRDTAAYSISPRQWTRLRDAALHYAAEAGLADTPMRFDVMLVDSGGICERVENARGFDEW